MRPEKGQKEDIENNVKHMTDWYTDHVAQFVNGVHAGLSYGVLLAAMERVKFKYIEKYRQSLAKENFASQDKFEEAEDEFDDNLCKILADNLYYIQKHVPGCVSVTVAAPALSKDAN